MKTITSKNHLDQLESLYKVHGGSLENCNWFGIRNPVDKSLSVWNDVIGLYIPKEKTIYLVEGTTDPSKWWTLNHKKGVDNLVEGLQPDIWALGKHKGKEAFVQGPRKVTTIRDTNRNFQLDPSDEIISEKDWWGIDLHTTYRAVKTLGIIGQASAGCQVVKHWKEFHFLRDKVKEYNQKLFSYLLTGIVTENKKLYEAIYG